METKAKKRGRPKKQPETEQPKAEQPKEMTGVYEVKVIRACKNPSMVEARLNDEKIVIKTAKFLRDKIVGKVIKISRTSIDGGQSIYDHIRNE